MSDEPQSTVAKFAALNFEAQERLRAMMQMNVPTDYEERKKQAIKVAEVQAAAERARRELDAAIKNS